MNVFGVFDFHHSFITYSLLIRSGINGCFYETNDNNSKRVQGRL